ncbi:hypothetical protein WJX77_000923 [Trebouxia sp. C0004]
MAGISKALEFPAEVVFQRVCNSAEAAALLQLSAIAQRVEMMARFLSQQQQVPQAHHELQLQLNHALQQLFQLSYTLQAHAEQNSAHSQQLQLQSGVTSKVAERIMLAHCEQELAQRARIVSETRATVQLPPFAQVMQQISDHVQQRCLAAATLQAQPSWPVYQGQLQHSGHTIQAAASPFTLPNYQTSLIPDAAPQQPSFHPQTGQTGVAAAQLVAPGMSVIGEPAQHHCSGQQHAAAQTQQAYQAASLPASTLFQSSDSRHCASLYQHAPHLHRSDQPNANMMFPACLQPPLMAENPQASLVMPCFSPASAHSLDHSTVQQRPPNLAVASKLCVLRDSMHNARGSVPDGSPQCANLVASAENFQLQQERHSLQQHSCLPMMSAAVTSPVPTQLPVLAMSLLSGAPASDSCAQEPTPGSSLVSQDRLHGFQQPFDRAATASLDGATTLASKQNLPHSPPCLRQQAQQEQQQHWMAHELIPSHGLQAGLSQQGSAANAMTEQPCDPALRVLPTARLSGPARLPGFSVLLQSVEQGQPAVSSLAGDDIAASVHGEAVEQSTSQQHAPALTTAAPATVRQDTEVPLPAAQANSKVQLSCNGAQSLPMLCGSVAPITAPACTCAAISAQPALPACDDLCMEQSAGMSTTPDAGNGVSPLPSVPDMLGASPDLVLSEGSFRFEARKHAKAGLQPGVLFTPVLRSRANEEPSVSGRKAPLMSGADDAAHAACASQQEVIIPDSEESPGRCSHQRLQPDPHTSLALHHVVAAQEPAAAAAADPVELDFSQTAEQAGSGKMECKEYKGLSSVAAAAPAVSGPGTGLDVAAHMHASEQVSSGCSLEALPMHSPCKACTQQGHKAQPLQQQQQQQRESKDHIRHSGGHLASLASEQNMTEDKAPQDMSSAFGTPIVPAPAGPSEHLGDHAVPGADAGSQFGNTSLAATAQHGHKSGPGTDAGRWPGNAEQGAHKAHLHDASQPSSSSLKRVPETPDSSENRSQPTQSPCRPERSDTSPRQAGPLRVVLVNNSDEQAGTQGVNVAAFLLMDSQKDSTSPGHPKPAQPLSVLSQAREGAANQLAVCNSQTQQPLPASQPQLLDTSLQAAAPGFAGTLHRPVPADASLMQPLQQQQQQREGVKAKAQPMKQLAQQSMPNSGKGTLPKAHPAQAGTNVTAMPAPSDAKQPIKPAEVQIKSAAANQASSEPSRWPGSCGQAGVADANAVHGVAAVVARARRSKSCSGSSAMRQHAAKKLTFQQLTLARKPHTGSASGDGKPAQSARQKPFGQAKRIDANVSSAVPKSRLASQEVAEQATAAVAASGTAAPSASAAQAGPINHKASRQSAPQQRTHQTESFQQRVHPEGTGKRPARAVQQHGLQQQAAAAKQAEGSSEQQWQAAISQLHTLAEKHSQDSQDNGDASADGAASAGVEIRPDNQLAVRPLAVPTGQPNQSEATVSDMADMPCKLQTAQGDTSSAADQAPAMSHAKQALKGSNQAAVSGALHGNSQAVTQQQRLPEANTQQASLLAHAVMPGYVGVGQPETAGKVAAAPAGADPISLFRAALHGYTGHSGLRQVMPQQRQQQGQTSAEGQARGFAQTGGQSSEHGLGQGPRLDPDQDLACRLQGQGQKRKAPEEEPAQGSMHPGNGHGMWHGGASSKRRRLHTPDLAKSGIQPAQTDMQSCSASLSPIKGLQMHETVPTAADTVGRAGAQPCVHPANTDARFQVLAKSAADAKAGCELMPAAEAGTEAKEAVAGPAVVLPGATDEASEGQDCSQGQPGGLRLDLSSEEDPLLCTQRMPPSQGGSGSGQGLFKTPDEPPADSKGQAPAQVAPQGTLSVLSPWNTPALAQPALAQPAPPKPPDSAKGWKLAGSVSPIVGHPAPPSSWMGSHEAGPATDAAFKDDSDGKNNNRKRRRFNDPVGDNSMDNVDQL